MPYRPGLNRFAITPPKCGTHTINHVIASHGPLMCYGHLSATEARRELIQGGNDPEGVSFGMTVRQPSDRLISAANHYLRCYPAEGLDGTMRAALKGTDDVFTTQISYWAPGVILFPFKGMPILRWLGWEGEQPRLNPSSQLLSPDEITGHDLYWKVMARYAEDEALYQLVRFADYF